MRLLTRSDFDGLACGAVLKSLGIIDEWKFVHPKDMQDGLVEVTENDVLANVPYVPGCGMWFDHHATEIERMGKNNLVKGECRIAPSAARVIYDYYDGETTAPQLRDLVEAADKVDSGSLSREDIFNPKGWVMLGFIMDPRTGLGRFREFTISNLELMVRLLDFCAYMSIDELLGLPDVRERVELYQSESALFEEMLRTKTQIFDNVILTDLRGEPVIHAGNRFMIYGMFPEQNVSIWVVDGKVGQTVSIAVGHSVLNRTCRSNIGALMFSFGGGGHKKVGTCQVPVDRADSVIKEITSVLCAENNMY